MEDIRVPFVHFTQDQISRMLLDMEAPDADTINQYSQEIRQWLQTETKHSDKIDDKLMFSFLVGNKFDMNVVKEKIGNYILLSDVHAEFFTDRDPCSTALQVSSSVVHMCILPQPTKDGYRVVYTEISDPSSKAYNIVDGYKRLFAQMDLLLTKDHACRGYVFIMSGKSASLWHASHWTVRLMRTFFDILSKSRPEGVVGIYFMDMSMLLKPVFTLTLKLINDETLNKKIYFNDKKNLESILTKEILPKQYGGDMEYDFTKLNEQWQKYLEQNRDYFI
uniref:Alpha-tocopherol transfer protein-like n=2 Tax=Cacopsylla melanoneura TaxID=428564 RepID=A0A8D8UZX1_9HEMI